MASAEQKSPSATAAGEAAKKNTEWEAVQKELEAERRRREEARVKAVEGGGEKSLYDVLQANKGMYDVVVPLSICPWWLGVCVCVC